MNEIGFSDFMSFAKRNGLMSLPFVAVLYAFKSMNMMKQQEKIDKIVSFVNKQGDTCMMDAKIDGVAVEAAIFIPEKNIIIFDVPADDESKVYLSCAGAKLHPFFIRQSESVDFTAKKIRWLYNRLWRNAHKTPEQIFRSELYAFLKDGKGWQKLTERAKKRIYKSSPADFYKEFKKRQTEQFDGDFDKTLFSFGDQLKPEFRPKPKRKRERIHVVRFEKVEPRGNRA